MQLLFATSNQHKVSEIRKIIPPSIELLTLKDLDLDYDIPETGTTLEENALIKSRFLFNKFGKNVISEDTGLEVVSLNGAPGVITARYAGAERDANKNMDLILHNLIKKENRNAQFRTIIALIWKGHEYLFEGLMKGRIAFDKKGQHGFGYDPIFIPEGHEKTIAELDEKIKNSISHRFHASQKLVGFLHQMI